MLSNIKSSLLVLTVTVLGSGAFQVIPAPRAATTRAVSGGQVFAQETTSGVISEEETMDNRDQIQAKWLQQEAHLREFENSIFSDPALDHIVDHHNDPQHRRANPKFMAKEAHKHDSFLAEVEHSIDSDPDLFAIVQDDCGASARNAGFIEREAHVHDSLLNEIEHSISMDPDL